MGKWSGRGQPPTRRKLHKWRQQLDLERRMSAKEQRSDDQRRAYSWGRMVGKTISNPELFERNWCS